ncbi:DUF4334 domain-containing protein [Cognatilysobacter bugurensis]|uniref:DUF4334 domain-containing protein n=1 Tax=Cognatilysobacter bugurensis TaxID=543356 RepID=A0A918WA19_9GAMM|nr:DUF4334 domain-containing protein [Lysobacter bugurensis]GHA83482.1 hypothetical protein GCM10007067_22000 [Lysobacter bugurensis]
MLPQVQASEPRPPSEARAWLETARRTGTTSADAQARFGTLAPVAPAELHGRWHGIPLHCRHPLDGLLERFGWRGKAIAGGRAHALLFADGRGGEVALDVRRLPVGLAVRLRAHRWPGARVAFALVRASLVTHWPNARVRSAEHRGRVTAVLDYEDLPIRDVFARIDETTVLGLMHAPWFDAPYAFALERAPHP